MNDFAYKDSRAMKLSKELEGTDSDAKYLTHMQLLRIDEKTLLTSIPKKHGNTIKQAGAASELEALMVQQHIQESQR